MARFSSHGVKQAQHGAWRVRVSADFDAFRDEWTLLESAGAATVFQSRAWISALCNVAAAQDIEPLFVLVADKATGAPLMLLPLCRRRLNSLAAIEFLDLGASDYNAPLLAADFAPAPPEFSALWTAIRAALPAADILRIDKSPATICGRPNPLASLGFMHRLTLGAWSLRLPFTREAYERDAIAPRVRKELLRKRRRLAECGPLNLRKAANADEASAMLRDLAGMRRDRYRALGRHDILADAGFRKFYAGLLARGDGLAEIHALDVGGERVAALFGLRHAGAFHFLLSGFHPGEWALKSAGSVAADMMLSQAIADGLATFDFTIGNAPYKRHFGAVRQDLLGGAQALSYRALPQVAERRIKGSLRTLLLPPPAPAPSAPHWR